VPTQGWADVSDLVVSPGHRRDAVGSWLLSQAADRLELGGVTRLPSYADPDHRDEVGFLCGNGFQVLTRTVRRLSRPVTRQPLRPV
jgi:GNAT superfamily N-acetyltransferase